MIFLKEKELFWIEELKTDVKEFGFNLRKDSSTKCFVSEETRQLISEARTTYKIAQYTKEGVLVKIWDTMLQILTDNPDFFRVAIYNCVNGYKKSYRGFLWKKLLKI